MAEPVIVTLEAALPEGVSHEVKLAAMFDQVVRWHLNQHRFEMPEDVRAEVGRVCQWMVTRYGDVK